VTGPEPKIEHLDNGGKRHREIDVAPFYVLAETVGHQDHANQK
jgi:hypothetical protein